MREKGAAILRLQIDESLAGYDGTRGALLNRIDSLTARAEAAEAELARCRRALAAARAQQVIDRERTRELAADRGRLSDLLTRARLGALRVRRSWERASALLRLLPPEQVYELRATRDRAATTAGRTA